MSKKTIIVIPCFNELHRLKESFLELFLERPDLELLMVDDGSTDGTDAWLKTWATRHFGRVSVLSLDRNGGKGEAVRQGVLLAVQKDPACIGYVDSDGATPAGECLHLLDNLQQAPETIAAVLGSRVMRLGSHIVRTPWRHYSGRVFATVASRILSLPVYDTQCGAKFFRNTGIFRRIFETPFHSRWLFDVELLGRLSIRIGANGGSPEKAFREVPLETWCDIQGSKRALRDYVRAGIDLVLVAKNLARDRARDEIRKA
jgi:dolichyl-phosphate beta-glucosyltransferase